MRSNRQICQFYNTHSCKFYLVITNDIKKFFAALTNSEVILHRLHAQTLGKWCLGSTNSEGNVDQNPDYWNGQSALDNKGSNFGGSGEGNCMSTVLNIDSKMLNNFKWL